MTDNRNGSHFLSCFFLSHCSHFSVSLCTFPDSLSLSQTFWKQKNNPLDIIDLCPQLPSSSQLFNIAPALLLREVVQREKREV